MKFYVTRNINIWNYLIPINIKIKNGHVDRNMKIMKSLYTINIKIIRSDQVKVFSGHKRS